MFVLRRKQSLNLNNSLLCRLNGAEKKKSAVSEIIAISLLTLIPQAFKVFI